jgi:hypothetical protein
LKKDNYLRIAKDISQNSKTQKTHLISRAHLKEPPKPRTLSSSISTRNQQNKDLCTTEHNPHISIRPYSQNSQTQISKSLSKTKISKTRDKEEADDDGDREMLTCGSCCPCRPGTCPRRKHRRLRGKWPRRWVPCWGSYGRTGPAGTRPEAARLGGPACPSRSPCLASSLSLPPSSLVSLSLSVI